MPTRGRSRHESRSQANLVRKDRCAAFARATVGIYLRNVRILSRNCFPTPRPRSAQRAPLRIRRESSLIMADAAVPSVSSTPETTTAMNKVASSNSVVTQLDGKKPATVRRNSWTRPHAFLKQLPTSTWSVIDLYKLPDKVPDSEQEHGALIAGLARTPAAKDVRDFAAGEVDLAAEAPIGLLEEAVAIFGLGCFFMAPAAGPAAALIAIFVALHGLYLTALLIVLSVGALSMWAPSPLHSSKHNYVSTRNTPLSDAPPSPRHAHATPTCDCLPTPRMSRRIRRPPTSFTDRHLHLPLLFLSHRLLARVQVHGRPRLHPRLRASRALPDWRVAVAALAVEDLSLSRPRGRRLRRHPPALVAPALLRTRMRAGGAARALLAAVQWIPHRRCHRRYVARPFAARLPP